MDTFDRFALTVATGLAVWCIAAFILTFHYRQSDEVLDCDRYTTGQETSCFVPNK